MLIVHFEYADIFIQNKLTCESYCLVGSPDDKPEV